MLTFLPAPLHRALYRIAHRVRVPIWRLFRIQVHGVRVIALDEKDRLLLVRHSYGASGWMPPGGGIEPDEDPVEAAARELREETGCLLSQARLLAVRAEDFHGSRNMVRVVLGRAAGAPQADGREIVQARFFALEDLPEAMPVGLKERLRAWVLTEERTQDGTV
ncbi:NUDIX domain-containing protein [Novosphingobium panipatense]|uniref:ADP-ribose pyrophosphatase YjhB, NUDIX family n=1 Tax=Novosphingobium panipatense TaxID=428991 RepID=A0ABY1QBA4_9SPHN|nr:NUDIX domain-containing protein [Novosphingobium panipatense]SMP66422.1 ADP-ribose pyrophosphatase YjhB, NUDIX family [Novosphingobium panipatense]